jgi:hypothetical protein
LAGLLVLGACGSDKAQPESQAKVKAPDAQVVKAAPAEKHGRGKPTAPVQITFTDAEAATATVRITFDKAADDVVVRISGYGDITVTSDPAPVQAGSFAEGQVINLTTAFNAVAGQSKLVVHVSGAFGSANRSKAAGLEIGGPAQTKMGRIDIDGDGKPVHVLPGLTTIE